MLISYLKQKDKSAQLTCKVTATFLIIIRNVSIHSTHANMKRTCSENPGLPYTRIKPDFLLWGGSHKASQSEIKENIIITIIISEIGTILN